MSTVVTEPAVDVVVLGQGFSGPAVAIEAALAGFSVVGIEKGPYWDYERYVGLTKYDEWGCNGLQKFDNPYSLYTYTWRNNTNQFALPTRRGIGATTSGHGIYGMANHFNGQAGRYSPWVYQMDSMTASRYGADFLDTIAPTNDVMDYPYTYADIESYYTQFEAAYAIAGDTESSLVPMSGTFPLKPHPTTPLADTYMASLEKLGYNPIPMVSFHASEPYVNTYGVTVNPCAYDGYCVNYPCETGAKANGGSRCIPALLTMDNYTLVLNGYIFRINVDQTTNLATSVMYYDAMGTVHEQPCSVVVNSLCQSLINRMFSLSGIGTQYNPTTVTGSMGRGAAEISEAGGGSITGTLPSPSNRYAWGNSFGGGYINFDQADDFFDHTGLEFIGGSFTPFSPGSYASTVGEFGNTNTGTSITSMGSTYKATLKNKYLLKTTPFTFSPNAPCLRDTRWVLDLDPVYTDKYGDPLERLTIDNDFNQGYQCALYYTKQTTVFQDILQGMGATNVTVTAPTAAPTGHVTALGAHLRGGVSIGSDQSTSALNMWQQCWDVPNVFAIGETTIVNGDNTTTGGSHPFMAGTYVCAEGVKQYLASPGALVTSSV